MTPTDARAAALHPGQGASRGLQHRQLQSLLTRAGLRDLVAGIGTTHDGGTRNPILAQALDSQLRSCSSSQGFMHTSSTR